MRSNICSNFLGVTCLNYGDVDAEEEFPEFHEKQESNVNDNSDENSSKEEYY